jgi:hypothetical protein
MSRIILICSFAATLAAAATQSADAAESAQKSAWAQDSLACADVGIDPGSPVFGQCVADLDHSLWAAHNQNLAN